jgi:hypothetical protein
MGACPKLDASDIFSLCSSVPVNFQNIYCCPGTENRFIDYGSNENELEIVKPSCPIFGSFPRLDSDGYPILKSPLNGTSQSPWVRVAFQQYCQANDRASKATNQTIITTGNISQLGGGGAETCTAAIKAFQYGWGTVDSGNRCRITIIDEEGGSFETWARRMATNTEGASAQIRGSYQMKVQWGWYISGSGPNDQCGQGAADPPPTGNNTSDPPPGQNTSYNICSPTLWFLPDAITVNWENGKFIYTLEGVDLLVRAQEQRLNKVAGQDGGDRNPNNTEMYFTEAVRILGTWSMPPFRVRFLATDKDGNVVPMQFIKRKPQDHVFKGPFGKWATGELAPLDIIKKWLIGGAVMSVDQTGNIETPEKEIGITANYDPILDLTTGVPKFPLPMEEEAQGGPGPYCDPKLPDVGCMILWSANGVPHCQGNVTNLDKRLKAVYVVNGGNCSPVIAFNPVVRWHFLLGLKAGGITVPLEGTARKQTEGLALTGCNVGSGRGPRTIASMLDAVLGTIKAVASAIMKATVLHTAGNLMVHAIEAELRVQGDPSPWLCSPLYGFGKAVGIIFINPFFLTADAIEGNCPAFKQTTSSLCNNFLTNKGWFVKGVEHQIKEGSYITTIKLALPAPGAELKFNSSGILTGLGGMVSGAKMNLGGTNASITEYAVGDAAVAWTPVIINDPPPGSCPVVCYQGGGDAITPAGPELCPPPVGGVA